MGIFCSYYSCTYFNCISMSNISQHRLLTFSHQLFFDHNVSSILSQRPEFKLKKGSAYHWDFFIVGINVAICSIIGIPPTHGLIPQAPLHVESLMTTKEIERSDGRKVEICVHVRENRITGFVHTSLILMLIIFGQVVLRAIPLAVIAGIFLFMGCTERNQFIERVQLWFTDSSFYNQLGIHYMIKKIPMTHIIIFTVIQILCFGIIFGVTFTQAAIGFPILILLLIPLRKLMPLLYTHEQLFYLDGEGSDGVNYEPSAKKHRFNYGPLDKLHAFIVKTVGRNRRGYRHVKSALVKIFLRKSEADSQD